MKNSRITISYLSFGSGHRIAAESIADSMRSRCPDLQVVVEDPFSSKFPCLPSILAGLQVAAIRLAPNFYDRAWRTSGNDLPGLEIFGGILLDRLKSHGTQMIIATHVIPCILASKLKRIGQLRKNVKLFAVVTDYALNPIWPVEYVDGYFVSHVELRNGLASRGVDPELVHVTGIPINSSFNYSLNQGDGSQLRLLIMAGGIGNGGYVHLNQLIVKVIESLSLRDTAGMKLTVVTGGQTKLKLELEGLSREVSLDLEVKGFVRQMHELMACHDIILAKPGGLIIAEALAMGKPLILFQPAPGVENANLEFLIRKGAALPGRSLQEVIRSLDTCRKDPVFLSNLKREAARLGFPNSTQFLVDHIMGIL